MGFTQWIWSHLGRGPRSLILLLTALTLAVVALRLLVAFARWSLLSRNDVRRRSLLRGLDIFETDRDRRTLVAFFHPNAGGGGERVLWAAIASMQRDDPQLICCVYTGDVEASKTEIMAKVQDRFGIALNSQAIAFVYLRRRRWIEESSWPRFTLIGQSIGSMILVYEALSAIVPDYFIDSMGYAFSFSLVRHLAKIPMAGYVHYPTISSTMLERVTNRASGHTNSSAVSSSSLLTWLKYSYYLVFMELYSLSLRQADVLMVNSTWTFRHVQRLLSPITHRDEHEHEDASNVVSSRLRASIVYPPCDTTSLSSLPLEGRKRVILSLAQFRPEKEQAMQLRSLKALFDLRPDFRDGNRRVSLIMAGSVRGEADERRLDGLRSLAKQLDIADNVTFVANASWDLLREHFGQASVGLSTMIDEHFGINVVEIMAAGLIPLTHASGGPLLDIVVPYDSQPTGFHAIDADDFARKLEAIFDLPEATQLDFRRRARAHAVEHFSTERFELGWTAAWRKLSARDRAD